MVRLPAPTALALAATLMLVQPAVASDPVADFYAGKRITLLISAPPGSGYDAYARLLARNLPRHVPGSPTIVPQNMPAAGGMMLLNSAYNSGPRDGTLLFTLHFNLPLYQAMGGCGVRYDAGKLIGLGRLLASGTAVGVGSNSPSGVRTLADAQRREAVIGATGATSNATAFPTILDNLVGAKFKIVQGYEGDNAVFLAMERGELDGFGSYSYMTFKAVRPDWLDKKLFYPIVVFGAEREPAWPDVPTAIDVATNPVDKQAMALASSGPDIGFSYFMPPEVPPERVAALRRAFADMLEDPAFRSEAEHAKLYLRPASGEAMEKIVHDVLAAPPPVIQRLRALMSSKGGPSWDELTAAEFCAKGQ
jgi:tripartite-type tricarboxylate transporter receptor subunit TctC